LAAKIRGREIDYIIDYFFATASFEKESSPMRKLEKKISPTNLKRTLIYKHKGGIRCPV
jgi:hypothetical protein